MEYVIEAENLCKKYMRHEVLKDMSIHVPKGSVYGLIGKNGAGKTTFMRLISGIQIPSSGEYKIFGVSNRDRKITGTRKRMGAVIESPSLCLEMSAKDNLKQQYRYLGIPDWNGIDELLELVGLSDAGNKRTKNFSLGMKQRLGIAMALAGNPDILILDEPVNGLDPEGIIEMRETVLKLNKERDITFVISSHILDEFSKIATHYGFIDDGHLIEEISAEEIAKKCRRSYTVETDDTSVLSNILESQGLEYQIEEEGKAIVFGDIDVDGIVSALIQRGGKIRGLYQTNETLESYFLNLLGNKDEGGNAK